MTPDEEKSLRGRVSSLSALVMALIPLVRTLVKDKQINADQMLSRFEEFWIGQNVTDDEIRVAKAALREFLKK